MELPRLRDSGGQDLEVEEEAMFIRKFTKIPISKNFAEVSHLSAFL